MKLAITSIQRNRGKWVVEWLAFHMLMGFERFCIYAHKTDDGMTETLLRLARAYDIRVHQMSDEDRPQLVAYQHAYNAYADDVDWMAFIDGDEFLHPTAVPTMAEALQAFESAPISALGINWLCYGSNGHVEDPNGLVMQDYPRHSRLDFVPNRHIKSMVRGRQEIRVAHSHLFQTQQGTVNTQLEPIHRGWMRDLPPDYDCLRLNHYVVQSFDFFRHTKQFIGAADGNPNLIRPTSWFHEYDRNEVDDGSSYQYLVRLKLKVQELQSVIAAP